MKALNTNILARYLAPDFLDYYLGRANERDGASQTLTFDKALKGSPRFRVLAA